MITRANNAEVIRAYLPRTPERDRLRFVFIDLPPWAHFWKKGRRGHRVYYLLWQVAALRAARHLQRSQPFEVVWHLTLANVWMGSLAPLAGGRFVLGPVGGGASAPLQLAPVLGFRGALFESTRVAVKALSRYLNPLARLAWRRAELVLVQNVETRAWLPTRHRHKAVVFPNALIGVVDTPTQASAPRKAGAPTMLFAGLLQPMKGCALAIRALEDLPEWRLIVCGTGPDERRLRRLVSRLNLAGRVEFRGWLERQELMRVMRERADVLIFPSLRDQAGFAVAEAVANGLPAVCLDRGGPKLLGASPVETGTPRATARALAAAVANARHGRPGHLPGRDEQMVRLRKILAERKLLPTHE